MAINKILAERVRLALAHLPDVAEKKMFGGLAFMVNNKMCISIGTDRIMCRIDPGLHEEALQKEGVRTVVMHRREYKGYVYVHEDSIKTEEELDYWINLALDFNKYAKASPKK